MTKDICMECGHTIYDHSGRPDKKNDACTKCKCPRMVRLIVVQGGKATIGRKDD